MTEYCLQATLKLYPVRVQYLSYYPNPLQNLHSEAICIPLSIKKGKQESEKLPSS